MGSNIALNLKSKVAVIMAGGKSSRMKKDKALLPFDGFRSLAEFQYQRLASLFSVVYITSKENKFDFAVEVIEDTYDESSPLVALVSIFESLSVDEVFVLSVDAPFISATTIKKLYAVAEENFDVVLAESTNGVEPLCAIYRRSFLAMAQQALQHKQHRLQTLFNVLSTQKVLIQEDCFMNLNYPQEYEEAKRRIEKKC